MTALSDAIRAMQAAPEDEGRARAAFRALSMAEVFVVLDADADAAGGRPRVLPLSEGPTVLAFDVPERLAAFAGDAAPFAAMGGLAVIDMLAGRGVALGVNLDGGDDGWLLPPAALDWAAQMLGDAGTETQIMASDLTALSVAGIAALADLESALSGVAEIAGAVHLSGLGGAAQGYAVAVTDAPDGARAAIRARLAAAGRLGASRFRILFLESGDPLCDHIARIGVRIGPAVPRASGTDPAAPPRLR